jgi:O-antigen ligase
MKSKRLFKHSMLYSMTKTIARVIQWILILIPVLVPLVFWQEVFFPYTFPKTILFRTLVEIAFALWLPLIIFIPRYRPPISLSVIAVSIFFGALTLTAFTGIDTAKSIWSDFERMLGIWTYAHLIVFFFLMISMMRSEKDWQRMIRASIGTATIISIIGIAEAATSSGRIISTIGNAAFFSSYLLLHFFLSLIFFLGEERFRYTSALFAGSTGIIGTALFLTEARAGVVGLFGGLFVLGVLFLALARKGDQTLSVSHRVGKKIVGVLLTLLLFLGILIAFFPSTIRPVLPNQLQRFTDVSLVERTSEGRLLTWRVAWEGWQDRRVLGWGIENFNILFDTHYDENLFKQEPWFDRAHNILFDIGTSAGVLGILAYLFLFGSLAYVVYTKWRKGLFPFWTAAGIIALFVGYILQNLFTFDTITTFIPLYMVLAFIAGSLYADNSFVAEDNQKNNILITGVLLAFLVVIPGMYYINIAPWRANSAGHAGWELLRTGGGDREHFERGVSYGTHGGRDIRRFFAEYVFEFLKQGGVRPDESLFRLMMQANTYMDANIAADPQNVKWYMYQGELYNLMAVRFDSSYTTRAKEFYQKARVLSPARPQIYLGIAEAERQQGNTDAMWNELNTVIALVPEYLAAHQAAAIAAIKTGDSAREAEEVEWIFSRGHELTPIRNAYVEQERYEDAAQTQERIIMRREEHPESSLEERKELATLHAQLAALYHLAGDIEQARVTAFKVLELDPARKNEVDAFLNSL